MCLVYGSNPERFASLVGDKQLPASRTRRCQTEYSKIFTAWQGLLDQHARQ